MIDNSAISVKNITKTYKLYDSHADRVKEAFHPLRKKYHRPFNALTDVSFDVNKGETLGIIGRNGSGKSTLLQIICGILQPTSGSVEVNGRVSALLELGAGFNPEFTGRQNVYINGSILGLAHEEIEARFDKIASFADIGDFINQPVKSYSSGMVVRLAFAVAINIEPDILIVDEALAVGDEAFQRKCMARLEHLREHGTTVLFVSHSTGTVLQICNHALLLSNGRTFVVGNPKSVVTIYHKMLYDNKPDWNKLRKDFEKLESDSEVIAKRALAREGDDKNTAIEGLGNVENHLRPYSDSFFDPNLKSQSIVEYEMRGAEIIEPHILNTEGQKVNNLSRGHEYIFTFRAMFSNTQTDVLFGCLIKTMNGLELGGMLSHPFSSPIPQVESGQVLCPKFYFRCNLTPEVYFFTCGVVKMVDGQVMFLKRYLDVAMFRVLPEPNLRVNQIFDFLVRSEVEIER